MSKISWLTRLDEKVYLAPKLTFLAVSLAYYTVYLFRAKFIKNVSLLQDFQYGDVTAVMAAISCGAAPLWGSLADRWGRHRLILALLAGCTVFAFEATSLINGLASQNYRFYASLVVWAAYAFFSAPLLPLTDYLALKMLNNRPGFTKDYYSRQVVFGTLGYGLASMVVGYSVRAYSPTILYYLLPTTTAIAVLAVMLLAPPDAPTVSSSNPGHNLGIMSTFNQTGATIVTTTTATTDTKASTPLKNELESTANKDTLCPPHSPLTRLLTHPNFMFMLLVVFLTGSARAVMTTFVGKYWEEYMQLNEEQMGIAASFGIALEVVIFVLGPPLLSWLGVYWMLLLAQLAMVLRAWAYVIMPITASAWKVYWVELLKGAGFGFTQTSGTKVASDTAPPELSATAQALYTAFYSHLPQVITAIAGGRCYQYYGPALMLKVTAVSATIAFALCTFKYLVDGSARLPSFRRHRQHHHHRSSTEVSQI